MSRETDNLTHHERKRLDYLYKNYHYLNSREQEEYDYLNRKRAGLANFSENPRESHHQSVDNLPRYQETNRQEELTENGLPVYPKNLSRSERKKQRTQASSLQNLENDTISKSAAPRKKIRIKRILKWLALALILLVLGMVLMFFKGLLTAHNNPNAKPAETEVFNGQDTKDGTNILILGTDGRIGQSSEETRTDSIMVLNVGNKDGKIKLVSFMRDILVNIDGVSYGSNYDQKLNAAYSIGEQNNHQGAELVRQMLKDNFDIDIKYYAMVDFSTFATAIDTLFPNGVKMNAQFSTVGGEKVSEVEVPDDLNMKDGVVPNQTIKVGEQRMDGRTLLNYARFRKDDEGDFGRTRRQQEVITAIVQQVKDPTKLFTGSEALGKIFALTSTNVPYSFLLTNGLSVATSGQKGIDRVTIPEYGDWVDAYDMYGGQGLLIDFEAYKTKLAQLGLR
ncbi:LCP family protein [Streptococcus massiliensis]|uniref:Regulatory protein MsrR n=1 Tax=Streptococcus massiliensis TaxID=313439 RepID=A0A380KWZ9_9STRE|nr:LCP family protein [Streptococcus massiliensis]SUN75654.1 putative transcriptional regulator [Streptococcus massiliensis]